MAAGSSSCPLCGAACQTYTDTVGGTLAEESFECKAPNCPGYFYEYAYGGTQVWLGGNDTTRTKMEFQWSYNSPVDAVLFVQAAMNQALEFYKGKVASAQTQGS